MPSSVGAAWIGRQNDVAPTELWPFSIRVLQLCRAAGAEKIYPALPVTPTDEATLEFGLKIGDSLPMSTVNEIESALTGLSIEEKQAVRDWLDELIEDQLEVSDEFKAKIERAKKEIADGVHSRVRQPQAGQ